MFKRLLTLLVCLPCTLYAQIPADFTPMLNGTTLNGWTKKGNPTATWTYQNGVLKMYQPTGGEAGWLQFNQSLTNFSFYCEWKSETAGNSGIHWGITNSTVTPVWDANEIQLCDDPNYNLYYGKDGYVPGDKREKSGSIYGIVGVENPVYAGTNTWNTMLLTVLDNTIELTYNGVVVYKVNKNDYPNDFLMWNATRKALSKRPTAGFLGLQSHKAANVYFRNLAYKDLSGSTTTPASRSSLYTDPALMLWVNNEGMTSQFVNDRSPNKLVGQNYKCRPVGGKYGNAAEYNHLDSSHINFGNQCNTENAVTIMAWVKLYSMGHDGKNMEVLEKEMMYWINYMTALDGDPQWVPYKNRFRAGMFVSTGPGYANKQLVFINSTQKYFPDRDTWIHLAMTYDRQHIKLYINGILDVQQAETRPIEQSPFNLCIGTKHAQDQYGVNNAPYLRQWDGVIDDAFLFKRALTASEIATYYANTQKGVALSTGNLTVGAGASSQTVDVISNAPYTVSSNQAWCTVNVTGDDEDRIVTVSATRNTGAQRSATVTIAGAQTKTIAVTQAAAGTRLATELRLEQAVVRPYPNPASLQLQFYVADEAQSAIIFNAQGGIVGRLHALKSGLQTLDVSRYASGLYSILVQTPTGRYTERFVVE